MIRKSADGGLSWTTPVDAASGLLFTADGTNGTYAYHTAPTPVVHANGRIYRAFEASGPPYAWPSHFKAFMLSAPEDADLLNAASWSRTNELAYDRAWTPAFWKSTTPGWLEGNAVVAPNGEIWNMLRFNSAPAVDKAAIVKLSNDNATVSFDPVDGFIDFPGGMGKFTIRYDERTRQYLTLTNQITQPSKPDQRNVLSLYASDDLRHWRYVQTLLTDDSGLSVANSIAKVGFQYVDWQLDGDDLIYVVRAAYDGADSYHNSNRITFHRLKQFRDALDAPAGYWTFDRTVGETVYDSSGLGVHGSVYGGGGLTGGFRGNALALNGTNQYVQLGNGLGAALDGSSAVTVAGWLRNDTLPSPGVGANWLFGTNAGADKAGAELYMIGDRLRVGGRSYSGDSYQYRDFAYGYTGEWHHVAGIIDYAANSIRLFLDGVEQPSLDGPAVSFACGQYRTASSTVPDTIGKDPNGSGFFAGKLDEVKVYPKALTTGEVNGIVYDGLKGYWALAGSAGTLAEDSGAFDLDGKIMGASRPNGAPNTGLCFDGTVDYVDLGYKTGASLYGSPGISVAAWIDERVLPDSGGRTLFGTRIDGATAGYELIVLPNAIRVAGRSAPTDGYKSRDFPYQPSASWHHVVGVLDFAGNTIRLYVDGVEQPSTGAIPFASGTYGRHVPTQPDAIGRSPAGTSYFTGTMGRVMVFGKPLTAAEAGYLYRVQAGSYGR
ncbi:LamG-like jellyroll fold domain-containing protein [Paenibacillus ginsengarvi]|uniref:LamG-like jellyroll fold domain-containing protein n=1 Tax=Paenibacillus ginsengarvi TaxID=400777 RepID=A0A3B0CNN1_9BACL|nr:LamG-like jellyroll fold domain-containing protein [Paenibacillus ginsengarvi]RKN85516.1 hypothetical protein D7M11_07460 [Paenibacillus ginsengarvi]